MIWWEVSQRGGESAELGCGYAKGDAWEGAMVEECGGGVAVANIVRWAVPSSSRSFAATSETAMAASSPRELFGSSLHLATARG